MQYSTNNIFHKIIHKQINAQIVGENEHALAFHDTTPKAKVHILVVPKKGYIDYVDFAQHATQEEQINFHQLIQTIICKHTFGRGRIMFNLGNNLEVMHMHAHVMLD